MRVNAGPADPWVRVHDGPARHLARAFALLWISVPFGALPGGVARAGEPAAALLAVLLLPPTGWAYVRLWRWVWRLTGFGLFHSAAGVGIVRGRRVVVPWAEIAGFETRPVPGPWGTPGAGRVLCVVRTDGVAVPTGLSAGWPSALTGRGACERAAALLDRELRRHR